MKVLPCIIAVCLLPLSAFARNDGGMVGQTLPDVRLNFLGPKADYEGKPLLLEFWATWCPPCRESIPHLNEIHGKYKDRGLVIIGVTEEPDAVIRKFQKDTPMEYAVATDSSGRLGEKMGVNGIPHAFLVDTSGKIVWDGHPMSLREEQIEEVLGGEASVEPEPASQTAEQEPVVAPAEPSANASDAVSAEVPATDTIRAEDTSAMQSKVGSEVVIEGFVKSVGKTGDGGINFINFGDRKTGFTAVVFGSSMAMFPEGLDKYANQNVRVRGTLENYQGRQMQIKITTPDQLELVGNAP